MTCFFPMFSAQSEIQKIKSSPILEEFFNYFLQDRFYPDLEFYGCKNGGKTFI